MKTLEQIVEDVATNDFPDSDHIYTNLRDLLLEEGEGREGAPCWGVRGASEASAKEAFWVQLPAREGPR